MSDRFPVEVYFGGRVRESQLTEIVELVPYSFADDWVSGVDVEFLETCALQKKPARVTDPEATGDIFDDLLEYCRAHQLSYRWHCDAKYEYDGELQVWFPGMEAPRTTYASQEGEPLISIASISSATMHMTLQEFVTDLMHTFMQPVPPLQIISFDPDTPEDWVRQQREVELPEEPVTPHARTRRTW